MVALALPTSSAAAADIQDGLWYYNDTGLAEVHQTVTGAGVRIALVDGLVNPAAADLVGTSLTVHEPSYCAEVDGGTAAPAADSSPRARHTTSMASLILGTGVGNGGEAGVKGVAPGASVTTFAARLEEGLCPTSEELPAYNAAFLDAVASGPDIIVVPGTTDVDPEDVVEAVRAGVVVVAAGGNHGGPVTGPPAGYNGVVATGTTTADGTTDPGSPVGDLLGVVAPGADTRSMDPTYSYYGTTTGSSNSAAFTAGALALAISAFPDATSNQILQALVRTTDGSEHEPTRSGDRGFGTVDVRQMLASDPSRMPDENPFIFDTAWSEPQAEDFLDLDAPDESETPDAPPPSAAPAPPEESISPLPVALGVAALALIAGMSLVFRRRHSSRQTVQSTDSDHHE
jgi:hypothetical protein